MQRRLLLALHVVGLLGADGAEGRGDAKHLGRLARMYVHSHLRACTGDDEARADRGELLPELAVVDLRRAQHAFSAPAVLEARLAPGRLPLIARAGDCRLALVELARVEVGGHSLEERDEAGGAGIDDIRPGQHLKLATRRLERQPAPREAATQQRAEVIDAGAGRRAEFLAHRLQHGQDRALARDRERLARVARAGSNCRCELGRGQLGELSGLVADTQQELREDGAGVTARAVERGVGDLRQELACMGWC